MTILGIDTSCDDTCVALIEIKDLRFKILSNVVSSQVKLHAKYGGVYPSLAKREHQRNLPIVLRRALKKAGFVISNFQFPISKQITNSKFKIPNIDFIGVTVGPGLEPCLWQGVNFAKDLAEKLKKPIIPVNHIEAHILANFLGENSKFKIQNSELSPAICLVVSGGHTQLILMRDIGKYRLIGETRDDAAGECFDKVARILGLGYPGGPAIAAKSATFNFKSSTFNLRLPRPMIYQKNYDFSFAGLKTAVLYKVKDLRLKIKDKKYIQAMCKEVQQAIIDVLIYKTLRAAKNFKVKSIILGGGVAANDELRRQFALNLKSKILNLNFLVPPKEYCTDNAAMVAVTAYFHQREATRDFEKIEANANPVVKI